jgi:hypothetical protein
VQLHGGQEVAPRQLVAEALVAARRDLLFEPPR